jgi:hypothetical protein
MESWFRLAMFGLIIFSFLRRIFKARKRTDIPTPNTPAQTPPVEKTPFGKTAVNRTPIEFAGSASPPIRVTPTFSRPRYGKKNDFRDVPPPPENPQLG